ncbi:D-2-hydroxyglutarate dehydrogenase mitochondrial [Bienertia sinuspersici]
MAVEEEVEEKDGLVGLGRCLLRRVEECVFVLGVDRGGFGWLAVGSGWWGWVSGEVSGILVCEAGCILENLESFLDNEG